LKAKVLTRFYDSEAKVVREKGDIINVTPSRFNEIASKGRFIEVYVAPVKVAAPKNEQ
jgi:hypothetical protein